MPFAGSYPVDAPPPTAGAHGLLDTARIVPEPNDYWMNGITPWVYPEDTPGSFDQCAPGSTFANKSSGTPPPDPVGLRFGSFALYEAESCTSRIVAEIDEQYRQRVVTALEATESWGVEQELENGFRVATNPFLSAAGAAQASGNDTAQTPRVGLAYLERAIANTARAGMIHACVEIATAWAALGHLYEDSDSKVLMTKARDTPVVVGGGYLGTSPSGRTASTATIKSAYVTGPMDIRRSNMFVNPPTVAEALNRVDNSIVYRAERYYAYDWDANLLRAYVRIDWTT